MHVFGPSKWDIFGILAQQIIKARDSFDGGDADGGERFLSAFYMLSGPVRDTPPLSRNTLSR